MPQKKFSCLNKNRKLWGKCGAVTVIRMAFGRMAHGRMTSTRTILTMT
jgi:hypothetical protein